ncbi:MAG: hypothetical protein QXX41_14970 [Nitrososphaerota archaeon]
MKMDFTSLEILMRRLLLSLLLIVMTFTASIHASNAQLPESSIYRVFKWSYKDWEFTWELKIPLSHYFGYALISLEERKKLGYGMLVTHDDPIIQSLAAILLTKAKELGFGEYDTTNFILRFVQDHYLKDDEATPYDEYPKFPVETIVEGWGDCEDSAILYAALMKAAGYDVILLALPNHMAVGVALSNPIPGIYVNHNGKLYFYAETTSSKWLVGQAPEIYHDQRVRIMPIPDNPEGTQLKLKTIIEQLVYTPEKFRQLEEKFNQLIKEHMQLTQELMSLQSENMRLKMDNERLKLDIAVMDSMISNLKPKAELLDRIINFIPIGITIFIVIIVVATIAAYYSGKSAQRKEIFGF